MRAAAFALFVLATLFVQPVMAADEKEVLTNEDILAMTEAGIADRVIVAKIMASDADFDISREQLVVLSRAGVNSGVLEAMMVKSVPSAARRAPGTYARRFEGTPCAGPGLYVEEEGRLRGIPPTVPQIQGGNALLPAVTAGILRGGSKAAIRGARSDTRTGDRTPTFWYCPEDLEYRVYPADPRVMMDPREFLLVVLRSSKSREERSFDVGGVGIGGQTGIPSRLIRRATFEDVGFGVYRIRPRSPLEPGEYGFYYAAGGPFASAGLSGSRKLYDFGVDG